MKYIDIHRDGDRCRLPHGTRLMLVVAERLGLPLLRGEWGWI
ncbi:MAG TPA: hypothetical protein PKJ98_07385 [Verrucomicrobiota bacterium]|nr:hypothetical protein [Verrucomicrobiota bacterium]